MLLLWGRVPNENVRVKRRLKKQELYPAYKGNRKRKAPPDIIQMECPGCGWKGKPAKTQKAEIEYVLHLNNVHHGLLDCAFCYSDSPCRFLPDFATLASHVQNFHPDIAPDDSEAIPPKAFVYHNLEGENLASQAKEVIQGENMLARPVNPAGGNTPAGRLNNWLKDSDVTDTPQRAQIVEARSDDSGRAAVIIKVKLAAGNRLDSLKANNPNFKILVDAFGLDEKDWKGKMITIGLEYDAFGERNWRRYAVPVDQTSPLHTKTGMDPATPAHTTTGKAKSAS